MEMNEQQRLLFTGRFFLSKVDAMPLCHVFFFGNPTIQQPDFRCFLFGRVVNPGILAKGYSLAV